MTLKCLIVEDEKLAQDVLKRYIALIPSMELLHCCDNASDAISYLHSTAVDLIFLDINMPELNGIDFLKTLHHAPLVIITTAYTEYALEGYEYSVCDYLLKPVRYERFLKAVNKAMERSRPAETKMEKEPMKEFIFIKEDAAVHKIRLDELLYVQALGNYLKLFVKNSHTIVTRATLIEIEAQLPETLFLRVHKSYLVAISAIDRILHNQVYIGNTMIPVGTTYRQEVTRRMVRR